MGSAPAALADSSQWNHRADNRVIYEVFPRIFSPQGNLKGVEAQIPRLKELGVDVIWLMPIYELGNEGKWGAYSSPYAVKNYKKVNPDYGTDADMHSLVNTAHAAGMEVWLDWVANHTALDHPWVSQHPEWYWSLTNHPHGWNDVWQLESSNSEMRAAMIDALKYWVSEFDIDGYRCDYASGPSTDFWRQARNEVNKIKDIAWLAEDDSKPELVSSGIFDYNYAWGFHDRLLDFKDNGNIETLRNACKDLNEGNAYRGRSRMVYLSNHDVNQDKGGTAANLFGDKLKPLTVLQFTVYGMPLIYNGQEIGLNRGAVSLAAKQDINWNAKDESVTALIKKLCELKHSHPALRTGSANAGLNNIQSNNGNVYAYSRTSGGETLLVVLNFSGSQATPSLTGIPTGKYKEVFTDEQRDFTSAATQVSVPANGYRVYSTANSAQGGDDPVVTPDPVDPQPSGSLSINVLDFTGWNSLGLYGWGTNLPEVFGSWPGQTYDGNVTYKGHTYKSFPVSDSYSGSDYNIIANDGQTHESGQEVQCDVDLLTLTGHHYMMVGTNGGAVLDANKTYILLTDDYSWGSDRYLYTWIKDGDSEYTAPGTPGWPGQAAAATLTTSDGRNVSAYEIPESLAGSELQLIFNDNSNQNSVTHSAGDPLEYFATSTGINAGVYTGVSDLVAESSDESLTVYYNLQGYPVDNPSPGAIYIAVRGNKSSKVLIR